MDAYLSAHIADLESQQKATSPAVKQVTLDTKSLHRNILLSAKRNQL